jgi:anti-sigma B factor antagonist
MKFSIDKQEKYAVLTLQEDNLNSLIAPQLKTDFTLFHAEGIPNFIFDISNVKFVDSSGLSAILTAKRLWGEDGSFILTGVNSPSVKKLIEISKLDTAFTIIPTVDESIDYVFMEQIERELSEED